MEELALALVWLGLFAAVFLAWYFYIKARNKERMALIEKGGDVSEIYKKREFKFRFPWLKIGIIFTGFSFGWLVAFSLAEFVFDKKEMYRDPTLIFGIIFLFTAISILIAYFVDKPKTKK